MDLLISLILSSRSSVCITHRGSPDFLIFKQEQRLHYTPWIPWFPITFHQLFWPHQSYTQSNHKMENQYSQFSNLYLCPLFRFLHKNWRGNQRTDRQCNSDGGMSELLNKNIYNWLECDWIQDNWVSQKTIELFKRRSSLLSLDHKFLFNFQLNATIVHHIEMNVVFYSIQLWHEVCNHLSEQLQPVYPGIWKKYISTVSKTSPGVLSVDIHKHISIKNLIALFVQKKMHSVCV